MEPWIFIAIAVYVASLVICYFKGILTKNLKIYIFILAIWIVTYFIKYILSKILIIDKVGIVIAMAIIYAHKMWILYIGPLIALIASLMKKKHNGT